jgi:hypothetical protein
MMAQPLTASASKRHAGQRRNASVSWALDAPRRFQPVLRHHRKLERSFIARHRSWLGAGITELFALVAASTALFGMVCALAVWVSEQSG